MMQITEYTALSANNDTADSKAKKIWKSLGIVAIMGLIGAMVFLSQNFAHDSHGHARAHSHAAASTTAENYFFPSLISQLSEEANGNDFLKEECIFGVADGIEIDSSNFDKVILKYFGENNKRSTQYRVSKIVKPKYNVEWVFGNSIDLENGENEHFVIVLQLDLVDTTKIKEFYVFTSQKDDESAESLHRRLHRAFDFNKNGQVCITEFPSMIGGVTGFGSIDTENGLLLSYMNDNLNTHIKFTEDEYVNAVLSDNTVNNINNFGDLRHSVRASLMDGYFTMIDSMNNNDVSCYYFDLSWNCDANSEFYTTYDQITAPMHGVSDSLFSNVCCQNE